MNTFGIRSFILWAALAVALLGFAPGRTLAQQGNPPPAQQPPRAGAVPRPVPPAPPLSSADKTARPGSCSGRRPAIPI